jgi:hypothetical protein
LQEGSLVGATRLGVIACFRCRLGGLRRAKHGNERPQGPGSMSPWLDASRRGQHAVPVDDVLPQVVCPGVSFADVDEMVSIVPS